MSEKRRRQLAIRELISKRVISSQEVLRNALRENGWEVTQSTLSRDLRELRLARIPDRDGRFRYAFPENGSEEAAPMLESLAAQLLTGVDSVQVFVIARTVPSGAQPVALALDKAAWDDVLGTIAGDDTVLIICRSTQGRNRVAKRLSRMLKVRDPGN